MTPIQLPKEAHARAVIRRTFRARELRRAHRQPAGRRVAELHARRSRAEHLNRAIEDAQQRLMVRVGEARHRVPCGRVPVLVVGHTKAAPLTAPARLCSKSDFGAHSGSSRPHRRAPVAAARRVHAAAQRLDEQASQDWMRPALMPSVHEALGAGHRRRHPAADRQRSTSWATRARRWSGAIRAAASAGILKHLITHFGAVLQHVRAASVQFKKLGRWACLLRYISKDRPRCRAAETTASTAGNGVAAGFGISAAGHPRAGFAATEAKCAVV